MDVHKKCNYLLELLEQSYDCIGIAIGFELEHADYDKVEFLTNLRQKIKKELDCKKL